MIAAPWLGPPHPVTSARDALLGRLLLCVHPAVRRESHLAAVLVWALDADPALVARAIRRPASTVVWLVRCFERRVRAVWLVEGIPVGRSCADRVGALVELLRHAAGRSRSRNGSPPSASEAELFQILSAVSEFLVAHPLAGSLVAHQLRSDLAAIRRTMGLDSDLPRWLAEGSTPPARRLRDLLASPNVSN